MLTPVQEKYLASVPEDTMAHVEPFNPKARAVAESVLVELQTLLPYAAIHHLGATRLGIAGQNDIDINIIAGERFLEYVKVLEEKFGKPEIKDAGTRYSWKFVRETFPVDIAMVAKSNRRIEDDLDTQQVLEARGDLRTVFEQLKFTCNGGSLREYTRKKFEFFNDMLHPHA